MALRLQNGTLVLPFETEPAGPWPAIAGTYRPATPQEVAEYDGRLVAAASPREKVAVKNAFFATHLVSWNVESAGGQAAAITPESVAALPYPVWGQLEKVVLGYAGELPKNSGAS